MQLTQMCGFRRYVQKNFNKEIVKPKEVQTKFQTELMGKVYCGLYDLPLLQLNQRSDNYIGTHGGKTLTMHLFPITRYLMIYEEG